MEASHIDSFHPDLAVVTCSIGRHDSRLSAISQNFKSPAHYEILLALICQLLQHESRREAWKYERNCDWRQMLTRCNHHWVNLHPPISVCTGNSICVTPRRVPLRIDQSVLHMLQENKSNSRLGLQLPLPYEATKLILC